MKIKQLILIFSFFQLIITANAQFEKRMEIDIKGGAWLNKSEVLVPDYGIFESRFISFIGADIFYNINRDFSIGINASLCSNGAVYNELNSTYFVDCSEFGGVVRYYFLDKKRIKLFTKGSITYNKFHESDGSRYDIISDKKYSKLGGSISLGVKTYFSKSFGFILESGYIDNGYDSGFNLIGGFFIDLWKK